MATVILVGAGASLAEALPSHPPRRAHPPLDATFFRLCEIAKIPGQKPVRDYVKNNFGIDPFEGDRRMEEVFNFVYSDAFSPGATKECIEAYWSLIQMYINAISRTTNPLKVNSRFGVAALLRYLWEDSAPEIPTFITFNQDLVIERALEAATKTKKYGSLPWNLQLTYGISFTGFPRNGRDARPFKTDGDASVRILKLHGSANWHYNVRSDADPKNALRNPPKSLRCINDERVFVKVRFRGARRPAHTIPVVVPPIYEKGSRYREVIGPIWADAANALERASRLIIFGYSFPDTDFAARSLLRRAFHRNTSLTDVTIIDTDPSIAGRVGELLSAPAIHVFRDVPTFRAATR